MVNIKSKYLKLFNSSVSFIYIKPFVQGVERHIVLCKYQIINFKKNI